MHGWPGFDPFNVYPASSHDFPYIANSSANTNHSLPSTSSSHLPSEYMWSTPFQSAVMEFGNTAAGHSTQPRSIFWVCKLNKRILLVLDAEGSSLEQLIMAFQCHLWILFLDATRLDLIMVKTECCMRKRSPILIIIQIPVALGKNILSSYLKILKLRMQYVPLYFPFILSYFSLSSTFS